MFIINKHYEATESNPNFKGAVKDFYSGKGGHSIGRENEFPLPMGDQQLRVRDFSRR